VPQHARLPESQTGANTATPATCPVMCVAMPQALLCNSTQKLHVLTIQCRPCDLWFQGGISRDCQLTLACAATSMMVRCS
jgi:hypothetical protein